MSARNRCVLMVGGSHSPHVRVPARMIREAGYRIVLADLQNEVAPEAAAIFDAVYGLPGRIENLVLRGRAIAGGRAPRYEVRPIDIEVPTRVGPYLWRLLQGRLRAGRLLNLSLRERPGVMYFQSMTATGMTAYYFMKLLHWPEAGVRPGLVTHLWGYKPRFPGQRMREIRVLRSFDCIHTSSPAVARMYRDCFEVPPHRISTLVRGIDLDKFRDRDRSELDAARSELGLPPHGFIIIHNRHLHPMYRVDIAVDAFIEVLRRGHDAFLILLRGYMREEDYERRLLRRIANHNVSDRVALMPLAVSSEQIAIALQLAHCAVNCVPFDALAVSILEAMYSRAVPVVRNLESYSEFVRHGETGLVVEGQAQEYADAIELLIRHSTLRRRMADAGSNIVRTHGCEDIFRRRTLQIIERCWHDW
ncbi:MAG: glycosyltransferase family 4 protein [Armatimonadetes bacterium]|nr:glycosyltransferase family 4 protein [Armatimonadota bacterium]